ncbi:MAG: beta-glucosidase [Bacteroidetes bacterium]|nr:beta-glucosidase [Bacteroidota bacterium]
MEELKCTDFGNDFIWGVSSSALQIEGGNTDGKGLSIWDEFSKQKKAILNNDTPEVACDFYNRYRDDIALVKELGIPNFRISFSWARIMPEGEGNVNAAGLAFYHKVIDTCNELGIVPWVTLYHWDLPLALEKKGGWTNREIINWFNNYVAVCVNEFKDKVKHWMVLNEPMVFTGAGYFLGAHAPGKKGLSNFLPAMHHAVLCQAIGLKIIKKIQPESIVGTTFSCSYITPNSTSQKDIKAAERMDVLLNRAFIEPSLGLGYPIKQIPFLKNIKKYFLPGDEELMKAGFDFIGIQNYTREVVKYTLCVPYLQSKIIPADKRKVFHTLMDWEVYPEAIYKMIKQFNAYEGVKKILVTENGASFPDEVLQNQVDDKNREQYINENLECVLRAKREGNKIYGYFVWSLTDNFEWAEGYKQRFGLIYVNFNSQGRIIKNSGYWYRDFLKS